MDFYRTDTSSHSSVNWYINVAKASKTQSTQPSQQNTCLDTTLPYVAEDPVLTGLKAVLSEKLLLQNLHSNLAEKVRHFFFTSLPFRATQV